MPKKKETNAAYYAAHKTAILAKLAAKRGYKEKPPRLSDPDTIRARLIEMLDLDFASLSSDDLALLSRVSVKCIKAERVFTNELAHFNKIYTSLKGRKE
jgi:hypothetical protein